MSAPVAAGGSRADQDVTLVGAAHEGQPARRHEGVDQVDDRLEAQVFEVLFGVTAAQEVADLPQRQPVATAGDRPSHLCSHLAQHRLAGDRPGGGRGGRGRPPDAARGWLRRARTSGRTAAGRRGWCGAAAARRRRARPRGRRTSAPGCGRRRRPSPGSRARRRRRRPRRQRRSGSRRPWRRGRPRPARRSVPWSKRRSMWRSMSASTSSRPVALGLGEHGEARVAQAHHPGAHLRLEPGGHVAEDAALERVVRAGTGPAASARTAPRFGPRRRRGSLADHLRQAHVHVRGVPHQQPPPAVAALHHRPAPTPPPDMLSVLGAGRSWRPIDGVTSLTGWPGAGGGRAAGAFARAGTDGGGQFSATVDGRRRADRQRAARRRSRPASTATQTSQAAAIRDGRSSMPSWWRRPGRSTAISSWSVRDSSRRSASERRRDRSSERPPTTSAPGTVGGAVAAAAAAAG